MKTPIAALAGLLIVLAATPDAGAFGRRHRRQSGCSGGESCQPCQTECQPCKVVVVKEQQSEQAPPPRRDEPPRADRPKPPPPPPAEAVTVKYVIICAPACEGGGCGHGRRRLARH